MGLSHIRPKKIVASFGFTILIFVLMSTPIGHQDITALIARHPAVAERWREHLIASPFGTIHAATFSFPHPLGTAMPEPSGVRLANLNPSDPDIDAFIEDRPLFDQAESTPPLAFPTVNRALKGDLLVVRERPERPPGSLPQPLPAEPAAHPVRPQISKAVETEFALARTEPQPPTKRGETPPSTPNRPPASEAAATDADSEEANIEDAGPPIIVQSSPTITTARVFFGSDMLGIGPSAIEPWAPGEQPVLQLPATLDPDIKMSALTSEPTSTRAEGQAQSAIGGETVAGKGDVTADGRRRLSPAQQLGLSGKSRAKAEKCLADAVYFEARGEPERGQKAVAQVVMNRVFSGYYPDNVCGVVYQNAHRHLACQFTFACDGIKDRVTEPDMWEQAKRIARDTLDGKTWLPEVGTATHYHASYVHPWWVRTMRKHHKIGMHIFYRPRNWADDDVPVWGNAVSGAAEKSKAAATVEVQKKL